MARLLGIDVGTSALKAVLIDETGAVIKSASAEYPLATPHTGWAEQSPEDWWAACQTCLTEIGELPDAIGLTGQMHGSVFLDSQGQVVRPALLWCDQRTKQQCADIEAKVGKGEVVRITCNPMLPGFQLPKLIWLRDNEPTAFGQVAHVLLPKDFLAYRLTGHMQSEPSDASGTGAFNVSQKTWSPELLERLGVNEALFPACAESWSVVGVTQNGVPVVAGGGDQAAGAVGVGAVEPGVVSLSMGTSGVAFGTVKRPMPDPSGSAHVFCHANGGWHAMGVTLSCGGAVRWARDVLCPQLSYEQMTSLASDSEVGANGVSFSTYLAGERCPDLADAAMGGFVGLSLSTTTADLVRAVFEGATYSLAGCVEAIARLGCESSELRLTGGGATSPFWAQMVADAVGKPCVTLRVDEGPALGAAILAGVGVGVWSSVEDACRQTITLVHRYEPSGVNYERAERAHKALYPALKDWSNHKDTIE